jgi:hypothetical protein
MRIQKSKFFRCWVKIQGITTTTTKRGQYLCSFSFIRIAALLLLSSLGSRKSAYDLVLEKLK